MQFWEGQRAYNSRDMLHRLALVLLAALPVAAQHEKDGDKPKNAAIGDPVAIAAGAKLFANGCGACHGPDGQGGRGPNLRARVFWHPLDPETLYKSIQNGIGGSMPAANFPEEQAWQVVAFVTALTAPAIETPVPGDVEHGRMVFSGKGGCANCHSINNQGGKLGPDLTNIASVRPAPSLRDSIVDPEANATQNYRAISVTLKNGKTLKGVARNRSNYSLQLQDAQGNLHLINVADVAAMTLSKSSPMPKDYGKRLTTNEIDDLVAYLARQSVRPFVAGK